MQKKTLVIGASLKLGRYSNIAINKLVENKIDVVAIGLREGTVAGIEIVKVNSKNLNKVKFQKSLKMTNINTVTLYLNAKRQIDYYDFIVALKPKRVIFNPGTENEEFYKLLKNHNINFEVACTLVLLRMQIY